MPIIKQKDWIAWLDNNQDYYGKCIMEMSAEVMRLLDERDSFDADELITEVDNDFNEGITGFMAGAIATVVSHCHSRGEEFRKSWNAEIGKPTGQQDSKGVLNPAIMNIG